MSRKRPTLKIQAVKLIEQEGRCFYCNSSLYADPIAWDHLIPYAYSGLNLENNWIASCYQCNGKKSDKIFSSEKHIYDFCLKMIKSHGSFGEGWEEDTQHWQTSLRLRANLQTDSEGVIEDEIFQSQNGTKDS